MTMPNDPSPSHSLVRLMLTGFLSGIISAFIAAAVLLALSDTRLFAPATAGAAAKDYENDLPTAFLAAILWFLPVGIFVFPPTAKFLGMASNQGTMRLLKFAILAAILWCAAAELIYVVLSPFAPAPAGVQRDDMIGAALSGMLFAIVYDLLLRRRDYLLGRATR